MNRNYVGHFLCIRENTLAEWRFRSVAMKECDRIPALLDYANWHVTSMSFCQIWQLNYWSYIIFLDGNCLNVYWCSLVTEGVYYCFSKSALGSKSTFKIFAFCIVEILLPYISIGCTERISMLFRELFKMVQ